jgi:hypothetical protein
MVSMDLRQNVMGNLEAGVIIGITGMINRYIAYRIPAMYDIIVGSLGRWGEPILALGLGFALGFVADRVQPLERYRVPSRWFIYGVYRLIEEAFEMVQGRGFAYIAKDGSIKTDPADEISSIYMQKGDATVQVKPGSRTAVMGIRRYVAVGNKRVYYFEAPYELASA